MQASAPRQPSRPPERGQRYSNDHRPHHPLGRLVFDGDRFSRAPHEDRLQRSGTPGML
jgi:hypothetical protein